jgi:UDP-2,3-diacylglucosamine hydrolase
LLWLYRKLHPDFAINLAVASSQKSRNHSEKKKFSEIEGMDDFAKEKIQQGFDYVIMGHRHIAKILQINNGTYVNIGDWIKKPTMVHFDGNEIKLLYVEQFLES